MAIKVRIPSPLQKLTKNQAEVVCDGRDITELVANLEKSYPGIKDRICDETGKVRRFVNIYINEEDIRFLKREATQLKEGDEVSIIPAIAGGGSTSVIASHASGGAKQSQRLLRRFAPRNDGRINR